jgi:hypothetical protein
MKLGVNFPGTVTAATNDSQRLRERLIAISNVQTEESKGSGMQTETGLVGVDSVASKGDIHQTEGG